MKYFQRTYINSSGGAAGVVEGHEPEAVADEDLVDSSEFLEVDFKFLFVHPAGDVPHEDSVTLRHAANQAGDD